MIKWQDSFKVKVDIIDEQHQRLFEIAEAAHELLMLPSYTDRFDEIMQLAEELKDYTKFHFAEEEKLMMKIKYNKLFSHKVMHQDFIEKMDSIDIYTVDENQTQCLLDLVGFITEWITEHILKTDKVLGQWYTQVYNDDIDKGGIA
ncbi:bacteriohemerythrin [Niameybacter massiliensis]|uniref:bacteriohemerythrin n=1 Tax=Niameybacter massiliensis TaxID=1658108 RepID=UPI0009E28912|nr:hemerythrin family protein [Niameybacter massiliensis]